MMKPGRSTVSRKLDVTLCVWCLLFLFAGCGSCDSDQRGQVNLCEDTGGQPESGFGWYQDDGYECTTLPTSPGDDSSGASPPVTCRCPPGQLFLADLGCQTHPDPLCATANDLEQFEAYMRALAGEDAIDCGVYRRGEGHEHRQRCMSGALNASKAAVVVENNPPHDDAQITVLTSDKVVVRAMYTSQFIRRTHCTDPVEDPLCSGWLFLAAVSE